MPEFAYEKLNLNYIPRKGDDIDLLDEMGEEGWELVVITVHNIAYLKRQVGSVNKPHTGSSSTPAAPATSRR